MSKSPEYVRNLHLVDIVLACDEPKVMTRFWSAALRREPYEDTEGRGWLEGDPRLMLTRARDGGTTENRMHLDWNVLDLEAETDRLIGLGATRVGHGTYNHGSRLYTTLADPEGNTFCLFDATSSIPDRIVQSDEYLHPFGMGPDLAALIMRSLRFLGDEDEGGYQMDAPRREGYNTLAQAFEDYLSLSGGSEFGIEGHPAAGGEERYIGEFDDLMEDALRRMKGLFERDMYESLWI